MVLAVALSWQLGGSAGEKTFKGSWGGECATALRGADSSVVDVPVILQLYFRQFLRRVGAA